MNDTKYIGLDVHQATISVVVPDSVPLGDGALQLIYRTPDGGMKERLLGSADEPTISVATAERPFSFDGDGAAFQLACEANHILDSVRYRGVETLKLTLRIALIVQGGRAHEE